LKRGGMSVTQIVAMYIRKLPFGHRAVEIVGRTLYRDDASDQWARVVMNRRTREMVELISPRNLDVLEISGRSASPWAEPGRFRSYTSADYPDYDVCAGPLRESAFDLVIAEQVFEHLLWPYRAARHVHQMLRPGGHFLITTPFLLRVHGSPVDCARWTELGLRHLLAESGFDMAAIQTASWGNRDCVVANFDRWVEYRREEHSLRNEPDFPVVVWALARK
jgi:SAM-dependent methyltransferase